MWEISPTCPSWPILALIVKKFWAYKCFLIFPLEYHLKDNLPVQDASVPGS